MAKFATRRTAAPGRGRGSHTWPRAPRRRATAAAGTVLFYCHTAAIVTTGVDAGAFSRPCNASSCGAWLLQASSPAAAPPP